MLEVHMDDIPDEIKKEQYESLPTPQMSVRRKDLQRKPIILIGQDESVFHQYLVGVRHWKGPKGERPLLPKSEGDGYMVSAFQSRTFGFGRDMTVDELAKVNERRRGTRYKSSASAKEVQGHDYKKALKESPLVRYFLIGANNDGYWNSNHMMIQFEDVVDCLHIL